MKELSEDAKYLLREIAKTPEGRIALAKLVLSELDKINWHLSGAIARCEIATQQEKAQ